jgi:DAK2 domain fusion protein YloV
VAEKRPTAKSDLSPQAIDGQEFKWLTKAALAWLQNHQEAINALNVYPVPDGDTGINMVLTMQSAWDEIRDSPERSVGKVAHRMAHGAMYGARGNSGVILSQIWRGFARGLDEKEAYRAQDLAEAFQEAVTTAYTAVVEPVEGTILTVARAVADTAAKAVGETDNLINLWERLVFAAHEAVVLTPSLLPVLAEAGVVDAGGQGLYVILEGMLRHMRGEPIAEDAELSEAVDLAGTDVAPSEIGYGYDVQFLIVGQGLDLNTTRQKITAMGECPLVVGDQAMIKVHVHVPDPGVPISYGASLGSLRDVVVEDMQAQYQDFIVEQEAPTATSPQSAPAQGVGVVAVVMGDGLTSVFKSLGASVIVRGGQTMNPSTQDLLDAIESLPNEQVIVLPNNSNVVMAAEQARDLSNKPVAVIPTKFVPEGVAALLGLDPRTDLETNVSAMTSAVNGVQTGEVTTATRSATIDGVEVAAGEIIGLHAGTLKVTGSEVEAAVRDLLKMMDTSQGELITLYWGDTVSKEDAQTLAERVQQDWPEQEIEVVAGGQPYYHYILSVE